MHIYPLHRVSQSLSRKTPPYERKQQTYAFFTEAKMNFEDTTQELTSFIIQAVRDMDSERSWGKLRGRNASLFLRTPRIEVPSTPPLPYGDDGQDTDPWGYTFTTPPHSRTFFSSSSSSYHQTLKPLYVKTAGWSMPLSDAFCGSLSRTSYIKRGM